MKHCRWCAQSKSLNDFYPHPRMADGYLNKCKECVKRYAQDRRLTSERPREIDARRYYEGTKRAYIRQRFKAHPVPTAVRSAQRKVATALAAGKLTRPTMCAWCCSTAYTEAAHSDYSRPLDVLWLCRRCHRRWDAAEPKSKGAA